MPEKKILLSIPEELHRKLKTRAASESTTIRSLIIESIERLLNEKPQTPENIPSK